MPTFAPVDLSFVLNQSAAMKKSIWPEVSDADRVEHLIAAVQQSIAAATPMAAHSDMREAHAPDLANVLLLLLASILESSPSAATPAGMRKLGEAAGHELHLMMKDSRRVAGERCGR